MKNTIKYSMHLGLFFIILSSVFGCANKDEEVNNKPSLNIFDENGNYNIVGTWEEIESNFFEPNNPDFIVISSDKEATFYYNNPAYNPGKCEKYIRGIIDENNQLGGDGTSTFSFSAEGNLVEESNKNGNSAYVKVHEVKGECKYPEEQF